MAIDLKLSVEIDQPVAVVCEAVTDLANMSRWFSLEEVRDISPGPLRAGSTFEVVTEVMGQKHLLKYTVMEYIPCQRFVYQSAGKYPSSIHMDLSGINGTTRLLMRFQLKVNRLVASVIKDQVRKQLVGDLTRLAAWLESQP